MPAIQTVDCLTVKEVTNRQEEGGGGRETEQFADRKENAEGKEQRTQKFLVRVANTVEGYQRVPKVGTERVAMWYGKSGESISTP